MNRGGDRGPPHVAQAPRRCEDQLATTPPPAREAPTVQTIAAIRMTATISSTVGGSADSAVPYYAAGDRHESRASSPATGDDRPHHERRIRACAPTRIRQEAQTRVRGPSRRARAAPSRGSRLGHGAQAPGAPVRRWRCAQSHGYEERAGGGARVLLAGKAQARREQGEAPQLHGIQHSARAGSRLLQAGNRSSASGRRRGKAQRRVAWIGVVSPAPLVCTDAGAKRARSAGRWTTARRPIRSHGSLRQTPPARCREQTSSPSGGPPDDQGDVCVVALQARP